MAYLFWDINRTQFDNNELTKMKAAIIGPGNIGTDLLMKLERSPYIELDYVVGIKKSEGILIAEKKGIDYTIDSIQDMVDRGGIDIAFDSTGAGPHKINAPILKKAGIFALDLTPAAIGPYCVPAVNLTDELLDGEVNLNMVTCAGQATVPIVSAINEAVDVTYSEIISSVSSILVQVLIR